MCIFAVREIFLNNDYAYLALHLFITRLPDSIKPKIVSETLQNAIKFCTEFQLFKMFPLDYSIMEAIKNKPGSINDEYCEKRKCDNIATIFIFTLFVSEYIYLKKLLSHFPDKRITYAFSIHLLLIMVKSISFKDLKPFSSDNAWHFLMQLNSYPQANEDNSNVKVNQVSSLTNERIKLSNETSTLPQQKQTSSRQPVGKRNSHKLGKKSVNVDEILNESCIPNTSEQTCVNMNWSKTPTNAAGDCKPPRRLKLSKMELQDAPINADVVVTSPTTLSSADCPKSYTDASTQTSFKLI